MTAATTEPSLASPTIGNFDAGATLVSTGPGHPAKRVADENGVWHASGHRGPLSPAFASWIIGVSDFCLVLAAAAGAFAAHYEVVERAGSGRHLLTAFLAATLFVNGFERFGGYRLEQLLKLSWQVRRILLTWGVLISALLLIAFVAKISDSFSRGWVLGWIVIAMGMQLAARCILKIATQQRLQIARNIVIFGAGDEGQRLVTKLHRSRDNSIVIHGIFDDRQSRVPRTIHGVHRLGTSDDLLRFVRKTRIDDVIIALPLDADERLKALFEKLTGVALDVRLSVDSIAEKFQIRGMSYIGCAPVLEIADRPLKHWRAVTKWLEDQFLAAFLLIVSAPLMALVALLIKLDSRGPVFFVQQRFGLNNEPIPVLKFRTMYVGRCDLSGGQRTVQFDPRVTRVGRILRAWSIDELPQLINVLRGEMSIVGPRAHPISMEAGQEGCLYSVAVARYFHRHRVRPGITGWAQVNGLRGEVDTFAKADARVAHDLYYIEHWSPWLDLKILLKTAATIMHQPAY